MTSPVNMFLSCILNDPLNLLEVDYLIYSLECLFGKHVYVALDSYPRPGYDTLLLRLIPGGLFKVQDSIGNCENYPAF